jgi:hypothetical protein
MSCSYNSLPEGWEHQLELLASEQATFEVPDTRKKKTGSSNSSNNSSSNPSGSSTADQTNKKQRLQTKASDPEMEHARYTTSKAQCALVV